MQSCGNPQANEDSIVERPSLVWNVPHLNYAFEKDEYACIYGGPQGSSRHVVLVHDILPTDTCGEVAYSLLCTKYSFVAGMEIFKAATSVMEAASGWEANSDKELVLHFGSFSHMGLEGDAEVVEVADIVGAHSLHNDALLTYEDGVEHVAAPLFGEDGRIQHPAIAALCSLTSISRLYVVLPICNPHFRGTWYCVPDTASISSR
jgi:hypothetical protein